MATRQDERGATPGVPLDDVGMPPGMRWAPPAAAAAAQLTLFLPWLQTGSTRRSAFAVLTALRSAGLMRPFAAHAFFGAIALLPGMVAAGWLLAAAKRPRLAAVAGAAAGLLVAGTAVTVRFVAHHRAAGGTVVAIATGAVAVVVGAAVLVAIPARFSARPNPEGRFQHA